MSVKLPVLLFCCVLAIEASSQCQIPNGSFEAEEEITDVLSTALNMALKVPVISPTGWVPVVRSEELIKSPYVINMLDQDTLTLDAFAGIGSASPGANGSETALLLRGDSLALITDVVQSFACNSRPERVSGYFKYISPFEHDSLSILVRFYAGDGLMQEDAIGTAIFSAFGGPPQFFKFESEVFYTSDETPKTAVVSITVGRYVSWPEDTTYYLIDELAFDGNGATVPVKDIAEHNDFLLAPNPVIDMVALQSDQPSSALLEIYDGLGTLVFKAENLQAGEINLSSLPAGLYLARLENEQHTTLQKIMKL